MSEYCLFAQYVPNLRKLNFHFWNQDDERTFKKVTMESDGVVDLERGDAEMRVTHRFQLGVKSLNPNTLCNLRATGQEICLSTAAECIDKDEDIAVSEFLKTIKEGLCLVCPFCSVVLVNLTSVHRVRPFPVSTDGFFCHPEDGSQVDGAAGRVLPTELWFDGHNMAFNHVLVAKQFVREATGGRLECGRCAHIVGRTDNGLSLITTDAVNIQLDELDIDGDPIGIINRPLLSEEHFLNLLCYGLQMNDITRAIVVADNDEADELFLLWLLEKPGLSFAAKWPEDDERRKIEARWSQKVLFQPLLGSPVRDPETESWSRDLSVTRVVLDESLGSRLLKNLLLSCQRLPPSARKATVFLVALLTSKK